MELGLFVGFLVRFIVYCLLIVGCSKGNGDVFKILYVVIVVIVICGGVGKISFVIICWVVGREVIEVLFLGIRIVVWRLIGIVG